MVFRKIVCNFQRNYRYDGILIRTAAQVPENDPAVDRNLLAGFLVLPQGEEGMDYIEAIIYEQTQKHRSNHEPMGFGVPFFKKDGAGTVKHDAGVGAVFRGLALQMINFCRGDKVDAPILPMHSVGPVCLFKIKKISFIQQANLG